MAVVTQYVQVANSSQAYQDVFGTTLAGGGGAGTEESPWNSWAQLAASVESTSPDHSADDLVLNIHPASAFYVASTNFDLWTALGRGANWKSITLQRWEAIVDGDARYADWYPTLDTHRFISSGQWTQGYVDAGVWYAGTGPVYKYTSAITLSSAGFPYLMCWGGHEQYDTRGIWEIAGTYCGDFSDMSEEGDFKLVDLGATVELYVWASADQNPTEKYGSFSFHAYEGTGSAGLWIYNSANVTFIDIQGIGGDLCKLQYSGSGEVNENFAFIRPRHRMGLRNGISGATGVDTPGAGGVPKDNFIRNVLIDTPNFDAGESTRRAKGSGFSAARGGQNGITLVGQIDGFTLIDPENIRGYSHGQIQVHPGDYPAPYVDQYPRNCHVYVRTPGKNRLYGGPVYVRGIIFLIPVNGSISGLRISEQTTQSQIGGQVRIRSCYWDDTCVNWSDQSGAGTDNWNIGSHIWAQPGPYSQRFSNPDVKFIGCKHALTDSYAMWGTTTAEATPPDSYQHVGGLYVDAGGARFRQQSSEASSAYTRPTVPFLCETKSSVAGPIYGIKHGRFVLDEACLGIAARHTGSGSPSSNWTEGAWPVVQAEDDGAWSGQITGNSEGSLASFGFDENLNYIGPRRTPVQTSSRSGRGYR